MHARPDQAWTVDDLAREVGLSRSALHERFVQYLGDPPMHYLANWRIQLGSRLLRESNRTGDRRPGSGLRVRSRVLAHVQETGRPTAGSVEEGAGPCVGRSFAWWEQG